MSDSASSPPTPAGAAVLSVDVSRWPLAVLTYAGKPTEQQFADHLREVEETGLARREPFVQVINQKHGERPDAFQRALVADHQKRMEHLYREFCLGEAYVVSSEMKGAMVAVFWMAKPPYPYTFVESV